MQLPPISTFKGTHYEMGFQQGQVYKENLQQGLKQIQITEEFTLLKPKWLPLGLFFKIARKKAITWLKPLLQKLAPNQAARIRGIADGAEMEDGWIYLLISTELLLSQHDYDLPLNEDCSDIGILQEKAADGEPIVGRNFDYARFVVPFLRVRHNQPTNRFHSIDLTASPLPGTFNGMNEKGVFIGTNECFPSCPREEGLSASILIQEALEQCDSTQAVIDWMKKMPRGTTNNWLVADSKNDIRGIEYTSQQVFERLPEKGTMSNSGFVVVTNHYETPELKAIDMPENAIFNKKAPKVMQGLLINRTSFIRLRRATEMLQSMQKVSIDQLQTILRDHATDPEKKFDALCHHDPLNITAASMIFKLKSHEIWMLIGNPCENSYTKLEFGKI